MLALMDFSVSEYQCALLCILRATQEHLETSKGWMPNKQRHASCGHRRWKGWWKVYTSWSPAPLLITWVEMPSPLVMHRRWDCSGYVNGPEWAHHHHLSTLTVAGTCLCYVTMHVYHSHLAIAADELFLVCQADVLSRETGLREQVLALVKPLLGLDVLLCWDTDGIGCRWVINVKKDQINSW